MSHKLEQQIHESRLQVALAILSSKNGIKEVKTMAIKGICEKDKKVKHILEIYGVKIG